MSGRRSTVYRCWSADGVLLYVGCTMTGGTRIQQHANEKRWWFEVARITLEHFATNGEARLAEAAAIANEHPTKNYVGRTSPRLGYTLPAVWPELLTYDEAGHILKVSRDAIRLMVNDGALPLVKLGRSKRIPSDAVRKRLRNPAA